MLTTVCKRWWVLMVRGLAAIALGICAMVLPEVTLIALVFLFGTFTIIDGIAAILLGFRGEADGTVWWTMVILGLLAIAAGIAAFAWPGLTLLVLATIIAVSAIVRGTFEIYAAIALRKELDDEWILGLSGAMSVIFGADHVPPRRGIDCDHSANWGVHARPRRLRDRASAAAAHDGPQVGELTSSRIARQPPALPGVRRQLIAHRKTPGRAGGYGVF